MAADRLDQDLTDQDRVLLVFGYLGPLALVSLRLDHALFGARAAGYHATNLALHLGVVCAAGLLGARLANDARQARLLRWGLVVFAAIFAAVLFYSPGLGGIFLEPPNFQPADPLKTPAHIAPMWYFTPYYAMLRAVPPIAASMLDGLLVLL